MKIFMVVDDSPVIRKVLKRILEDMDIVVVEASDITQARQMCAQSMPDGILVDWDLPGDDSIEFISWLSPKMKDHGGKILYCTSELLVVEMTKAKRAGADGFLLKPFDRQIIERKMLEFGILETALNAA
ncbi:MAG: response regulator [Rhizobiales bacterium]|nr:response regulator [Hyphomicrobiales bacterium]